MKILHSYTLRSWKVTIFHMSHRRSVKIENGYTEQWYKFRDGSTVHTIEEIEAWLDEARQVEVENIFRQMAGLLPKAPARDDEFPTIL